MNSGGSFCELCKKNQITRGIESEKYTIETKFPGIFLTI